LRLFVIAIIDYGMGNLRSVQKGFEAAGADARIVSTAKDIETAEKVVLPGVGAFRDAIAHIREQGLFQAIRDAADSGRPFLGICLGLQLLFDVSYEDGEYQGLRIIPGKVLRFGFDDLPEARSLKIPHMGWNQLIWDRDCPLLAGLTSEDYFYFVHSFYVLPDNPGDTIGRCQYGHDFTAMIWKDNVFATQFHPEKSQANGLRILKNFADL
jgi:glutamine amidotransferase